MEDNCARVMSEYDKKRLKANLDRYNLVKEDPSSAAELKYIFDQLCGHSEEDFKEAELEIPKELRRTLNKLSSN